MSENEIIAKAAALRPHTGWRGIARITGKSDTWLRNRLDPEFRECKKLSQRRYDRTKRHNRPERRSRHESKNRVSAQARPMSPQDYKRWLAEREPDTRDFTQRFCGDPRPGRSALDMRT